MDPIAVLVCTFGLEFNREVIYLKARVAAPPKIVRIESVAAPAAQERPGFPAYNLSFSRVQMGVAGGAWAKEQSGRECGATN